MRAKGKAGGLEAGMRWGVDTNGVIAPPCQHLASAGEVDPRLGRDPGPRVWTGPFSVPPSPQGNDLFAESITGGMEQGEGQFMAAPPGVTFLLQAVDLRVRGLAVKARLPVCNLVEQSNASPAILLPVNMRGV